MIFDFTLISAGQDRPVLLSPTVPFPTPAVLISDEKCDVALEQRQAPT